MAAKHAHCTITIKGNVLAKILELPAEYSIYNVEGVNNNDDARITIAKTISKKESEDLASISHSKHVFEHIESLLRKKGVV